MTPIEILALVFAVIILLKALVLIVSPKKSLKKSMYFFERPALAIGAYVVMLLVTGYIVINALGIVITFAAMTFGISLIGLSLVMYPKPVMKLSKTMLKDRKRLLLVLVIWIVLAVWTLYTLFG